MTELAKNDLDKTSTEEKLKDLSDRIYNAVTRLLAQEAGTDEIFEKIENMRASII